MATSHSQFRPHDGFAAVGYNFYARTLEQAEQPSAPNSDEYFRIELKATNPGPYA